MRSRSSRLFVVLLHLVGVSQYPSRLPFSFSSFESGVGIVGVHPLSILLEPLELQAAGGLSELLKLLEDIGYDVDETVLKEPFWLQDDSDGSCLGPSGFSECGDATLWRIRRRKKQASKRSRGKRRKDRNTIGIPSEHLDNQSKGVMQVQEVTGSLSASLRWDEENHDEPLISTSKESYQRQTNELDQKEEDNTQWEYALQLADVVAFQSNTQIDLAENDYTNKSSPQEINDENNEGECILSMIPYSMENRNTETIIEENKNGMLQMGSCVSNEAWSWTINEGGVLQWHPHDSPGNQLKNDWGQSIFSSILNILRNGALHHNPLLLNDIGDEWNHDTGARINDANMENQASCVWKKDHTSAVTAPCDQFDLDGSDSEAEQISTSPVSFSVIQYQNSAAKSPQLPRFPRTEEKGLQGMQGSDDRGVNPPYSSSSGSSASSSSLPHMKRTSQSKSTAKTIGSGGSLGVEKGTRMSSKSKVGGTGREILSPMGVGGYFEKVTSSNEQIVSPMGVGGYFENISVPGKRGTSILHHPPSSSPSSSPHLHHDDTPHRPRKIPVHPYIAASVNGRYEDPNTGLSYPTDISEYLGHNRKEIGRHTLTGLGVYTRTMLKIKVYGVAFYVSKRDVLADPTFAEFSTMDATELSQSLPFYKHLMTMGSSPQSGGHFDRTLFVQLNMQLSTETVRQSLTADWQLLSQEHKDLLSNSSLKQRHADERMLERIQSEENTSNCSCGQLAPPEYEADTSCCARGTEMVFTWRKNGDMELRVDGRVMDTFPHPEIGRGIFYEYLRDDDPMSAEAREHFVDGFPFLLAPLAQLKGFVSRSDASNSRDSQKVKSQTSDRNIQKSLLDAFDHVQNRVDGATTWVQNNIQGGVSNVNQAIRTIQSTTHDIGSNIQNFSSDLDKRRGELWRQMIYNRDESMRFVLSSIPFLPKNTDALDSKQTDDTNLHSDGYNMDLNNKTEKDIFIFSPQIAKMLGDSSKQRPVSDEIGVIIEPTMSFTHMLFLYLVHFYLVLLLIVSVPDSSSTQVVKRSSASTLDSESDHMERCLDLTRSMNENDHDHSELSSTTTPCSATWNGVPGSIPKFVVERNGVEGNVEELMAEDERDAAVADERQRIMKKSLSYFL